MFVPSATAQRGRAWKADARNQSALPEGRARLVFTSPPYLRVVKYGKYNWIRLWMLGHDPREVDAQLTATTSLRHYLDFMSETATALRGVVSPDGYACFVIGDVTDRSTGTTLNLAEEVWHGSVKSVGWRRLGILNDHLPQQHKVSRIWGRKKKGHATRVDRVLILAPPHSRHRLPPRPREVAWGIAHNWARSNGKDS